MNAPHRRAALYVALLLAAACTDGTANGDAAGDASLDIATAQGPDAATAREPAPPPARYAPDDGPSADGGTIVAVASEDEILTAIAHASPGDVITVAPGTYRFSSRIDVDAHGTSVEPIFLRARRLGEVIFALSHRENFRVRGRAWVFENIRFSGACETGAPARAAPGAGAGALPAGADGCEHAFHIVGDADDVLLRHNEVIDFASHVKLNGEVVGEGPARAFPDRLGVIGNLWYNTRYVANDAPHNILNLDGGRGHVVRGNVFADYSPPYWLQKSASAVYAKASVRGLLVEQNLIVCEKARTRGQTTRGIQLGDGIDARYCDGDADGDGVGDCIENGQNQEALVRNNIIMNCNNRGTSAGIMVQSDRESRLLHNTVFTGGGGQAVYHVGHPDHDTWYAHNLVEYGLYTAAAKRRPVETGNLYIGPTGLRQRFRAPDAGDFALDRSRGRSSLLDAQPTHPAARYDFCGAPRGEAADYGAVEYSVADGGEACAREIRRRFQRIPAAGP